MGRLQLAKQIMHKPGQISYYYFLLMLESIETILVAIDDQVCAAFVQLIEVRPSFLEVRALFWFFGVF